MTNEEWYRYDVAEFRMKLTEAGKQIPEVVQSYEEFYSPLTDDDGEIVDAWWLQIVTGRTLG